MSDSYYDSGFTPTAYFSSEIHYSPIAYFYGYLGIGIAMALTTLGSAIGTYRSARGLFKQCATTPKIFYRCLMPVIMAGIVGIYGLVTAIIAGTKISEANLQREFAHLAAGLCVGFSGLSSGIAIGIAGETSVPVIAQHPEVLMGSLLILIFAEVLGLYGFIIGIIISNVQ